MDAEAGLVDAAPRWMSASARPGGTIGALRGPSGKKSGETTSTDHQKRGPEFFQRNRGHQRRPRAASSTRVGRSAGEIDRPPKKPPDTLPFFSHWRVKRGKQRPRRRPRSCAVTVREKNQSNVEFIASINVSTQRATFAALLGALVTGINTVLPGVDPFVVDGVTIARATLLARIQAALDAISAVKAARAALQSAVAKQNAAIVDARGLRAGMKRVAQTKFGPASPTLQQLGYTPQRTTTTPVAVKAEARVKAKATGRGRRRRPRRRQRQQRPLSPTPAAGAPTAPKS